MGNTVPAEEFRERGISLELYGIEHNADIEAALVRVGERLHQAQIGQAIGSKTNARSGSSDHLEEQPFNARILGKIEFHHPASLRKRVMLTHEALRGDPHKLGADWIQHLGLALGPPRALLSRLRLQATRWPLDVLAVIDVGSNSVRLQIGRYTPTDGFEIVAQDRVVTRLGEGVFRTHRLDEAASALTLDVLRRFQYSARHWHATAHRAVATSALREARNARTFLRRVRETTGLKLEIISGRREAELIHRGILAGMGDPPDLLAIDIGGGSCELTVSHDGQIRYTRSLPLGAVRLTERFIHSDPARPAELRALRDFVRAKLERPGVRIRHEGFGMAVGSSGSIAALAEIGHRSFGAEKPGMVTLDHLEQILDLLAPLSVTERRRVPGLGPRRAEIILAGCVVLYEILRAARTRTVDYTERGLRDGLMQELIDQLPARRDEQAIAVRQRDGIERLARRFSLDLGHARQVTRLCLQLFDQLRRVARLSAHYRPLLEAAAMLHDIGRIIGVQRHHRHSHYILTHAHLPGFSEHERELIALIARYHRKTPPRLKELRHLPKRDRKSLPRLAMLLRIADALDSGHRAAVKRIQCRIAPERVRFRLAGQGSLAFELLSTQDKAKAFEDCFGRAAVFEWHAVHGVPSLQHKPLVRARRAAQAALAARLVTAAS